jgi:hypothetical protein
MVQSCPRSLMLHVRDFSRKAYLMAIRVSKIYLLLTMEAWFDPRAVLVGFVVNNLALVQNSFSSALLYL